MQEITHNIDLNLSQPNNFEYIHIMQGDYNAEKVIATLFNGNQLYTIDAKKASLQGSTSDGGLILQDGITISEDKHQVTFEITKEMSSCTGELTCNIVLSSDNQKKSTFPFVIKNTADITGRTPVSVLTTISDYVDRAEKAASDAEKTLKDKADKDHKHTKSDITDFPTLGTASAKDVASTGNASTSQVVMGNDTRLSDARKASDVHDWAKASTKPSYTKSEVGLGNVDNTSDTSKPVSTAQQTAIDTAYANANKYTDKKVADLIGSAPETMDTLEEVAAAIQENKDVEKALNEAIGKKANQTELDTHTGNSTIHITASERTNWNTAKTHADSAHARTDATKVEKSTTNGNIKINGTETTVYTHPSGTNPHGTTKSDVGLGNVGNFKAVSTVESQKLTDTEKSNARANIGAQVAGSYASSTHNHDDKYQAKGSYASANHTHDLSTMINGLSIGTATPSDADYYVSQYAGGGDTTTTYHRRPVSALWSYIKSKADKVYAAISHTHTKSQITDFPTSMPANGGTSTYANYVYATSHQGSWYQNSQWDGTYFQTNFKNGDSVLPMKVQRAYSADAADYAGLLSYQHTNEINFKGGEQQTCYFNYRNADTDASGTSANIEYRFCNYTHETSKTTVTAGTFNGNLTGSAGYITGFSKANSDQTWGNQIGTFIAGMDDSTGGSIAFRRDNPSSGKLSVIIDGNFYQNEGKYACLDTNNYSSYALPLSGGTITGTLGIRTRLSTPLIGGTTAAEQIKITTYSNHSLEFYPYTDNRSNCGLSSYKWYAVWSYAYNGASDRKLKTNIKDIDVKWADAFIDGLKPSTYNFKKNTFGKTHTGFIAQDVEDLILSLGMDRKEFAGLVKTLKHQQTGAETYIESITDPDNFEGDDENYDYSLRYDDFIAPLVTYCQNLKKKNTDLEDKYNELTSTVNEILKKIN